MHWQLLSKAKHFTAIDQDANQRASSFVKHGIQPLDTLHLALAEASQADYFCTCDDSLLKRAGRVQELKVRVISPVTLLQEIEK